MRFHDPDEEHGPFPHRVLMGGTSHEVVICAWCDHWINREVDSCDCPYKCHNLGVMLAAERRDMIQSMEIATQELPTQNGENDHGTVHGQEDRIREDPRPHPTGRPQARNRAHPG